MTNTNAEVKVIKDLKDLEGYEVQIQNLDNLCEANSLTYGYEDTIAKLLDIFEDISEIAVQSEYDKLHEAMCDIDKLINESSHFIELTDLNASDGFKAYKLHQKLCLKRREIKDAIGQLALLMRFYKNKKNLLSELKILKEKTKERSPNRPRQYKFRNLNNMEEFKIFKNFDYTESVISRK